MPPADDDLLVRGLDLADLIGVLERSATEWSPAADPSRRRPSCGLCLADRAWVAEAPALAALPHAVSHPLVGRIDRALQAAEFDAHAKAEEDAWMHIRAYETIDREIDSATRAFDERARVTVLEALDRIEPAVARVRETIVEPQLARYLERHTMTEPPWQWLLE